MLDPLEWYEIHFSIYNSNTLLTQLDSSLSNDEKLFRFNSWYIYMCFPLQIRERRLDDDPTTETDEILYEDANLVSNSI